MSKEKNQTKIEWEGPFSLSEERGFLWYVFFILISIGLIIFAFEQKNFLFMILVFLGAVLILMNGNKKEKAKYLITEDGIFINGKENVYKYENLLGFSIMETSEKNNFLILHTKNYLAPHIEIYLPKEKKASVAEFLKSKLEEKEYEESLVNILWKRLKL